MAGTGIAGILLIVHGNVQGVGYRWLVRAVADRYGITGSVRNMPDGSVKVTAYGDRKRLESFTKSITVDMPFGPSVMHVESEDIRIGKIKIPDRFVIEAT